MTTWKLTCAPPSEQHRVAQGRALTGC
jgi:hypothetical protein